MLQRISLVVLFVVFFAVLIMIPTKAISAPLDQVSDPPYTPEGINFWSYTGPQQEAPQVIQVVIDPQNPAIVYAATNQGVYRSTDGGENWNARNGNLGSYGELVVTGLAIDPTNSQTLIIGTWGAGLLKSTDSGVTWTRLGDPIHPTSLVQNQNLLGQETPLPVVVGGPSYSYREDQAGTKQPSGIPISWKRTAVRRVVINPANKNEVFACVDDGYGLYRSADGGATWTKITLGTGSSRTYTFAPSNNQIRYASFGSWGTTGGFYRTTNGGTTWTQVGDGTILGTVVAVAIHPTDSNIVLAGTSGDGLYRSVNGGVSWDKVNSSESTFFSVMFSPSNPSIAYAGAYTWVYRSGDGGATWGNADTSFPAWYIEGLAIHPTQPETVLVGSNEFWAGGVYKRTTTATSFVRKVAGMQDVFVLAIEQDPNNSSIIYASTWGAGTFRSDDSGVTWVAKNSHEVPYVYDIEAVQGPTSTILYGATFYSDWGILKSYDRGETWDEVSWDYPSYISFDLESVGGDPDHLVAATYDGMQYSYDGGVNWYTASGLDTNSGIVLQLCEFSGTNRLLAATYGGGVFYSSYGYSWYEANVGMASYGGLFYAFDVACSADVPGLGYAASLGIYQTTDYGEHWSAVNAGIPKEGGYYPLQFRSIEIAPSTGDIFAGSYNNGIYLAPNGVPLWFDIGTGLVEQRIRSLAIVGTSPVRAFAGTNGKGVWEYTLTNRPSVKSIYLPLTLRSYYPVSSATDTYEPNNDSSQAYALPGPGIYHSYIWTSTDEDWYQLNVTTLGPITIDLSNIPSGMDYDIEFYTSAGRFIGGSWISGNSDEKVVFQPIQTGSYYVVIYSYSGSSQKQAYRLSLSYNSARGSGRIYGTVVNNGYTQEDIFILLYYYNGYRSTRVSTLTDSSGNYNFWGMAALPVGHTYQVYYPNYESNTQALSYWGCWSFTGYQAGQTYEACSFDIKGVSLVSPNSGETRTLPVTFQWGSRGITGEYYQVNLRRYEPTYAYYYSPQTTGASYTLNSLPSGFTYGSTNYWSVDLQNDIGYGASYYMRNIIFSSSLNGVQLPVDEQIPTCDFAAKEDSSAASAPQCVMQEKK